jgi:hypothetical protein
MESLTDFKKMEKLVVFDFDDTLFLHTYYQVGNSCSFRDKDILSDKLSDKTFLERVVRGFKANGINMGVASFGRKALIINTMNTLLYGPVSQGGWPAVPYFNASNVVTVPDLRTEWKQTLHKISSTFKDYVKQADGNVDAAFEKFLAEKKPEREAKYFCLKLNPSAKVQMIAMICDYYNKLNQQNISLQDVRFFDDDADNVRAALSTGIMAHLVPASSGMNRGGLTEQWWHQECKHIDSCSAYQPYFQEVASKADDAEYLSSSSELSWGFGNEAEANLKRSKVDDDSE